MNPPSNEVPPQPTACDACDQPFKDKYPVALLRSYSSHPSHPEWAWRWVCDECLLELAKYSVP